MKVGAFSTIHYVYITGEIKGYPRHSSWAYAIKPFISKGRCYIGYFLLFHGCGFKLKMGH
jgi:hypothetical protein